MFPIGNQQVPLRVHERFRFRVVPFLADCPARLTVELLADKWTAVVLYGLSQGPVRHGELIELIGGISRKMLTQTLRRPSRRTASSGRHRLRRGAAPRVEYELTPARSDADRSDPHPGPEWARANGDASCSMPSIAD